MTAPQLLAAPRPARSQAAAPAVGLVPALAWIAGHAVLGVAGLKAPTVATAHAFVVLVALGLAMVWGRRLDRLVAITGYGALCDVYWRMTESRAPWELSKYLLVLGSVAILVRHARSWRRPLVPLGFLACLLSGILAVVVSEGLVTAKDEVAAWELGLLALGLGCLAFRQLVATETDGWNLGWVLLGPVTMVLAVTTWSTLTTSGIAFTDESNFDVTGGFGPNQVSTILGLGMLICGLLAYQRRGARASLVLAGIAGWCLWGAFLTFSRGGVYSLVIAGAATLLVGLGTRGSRARSAITAVVAVVGLVVIFGSVNDFTGNWLDSRYSTSGNATAGRSSLAEQDLDVFLHHPLWGVGSGQSERYHSGGILSGAAAHTEYTRMLAEHGLPGLVAIVLLVVMLVGGFRLALSRWNRLVVVGSGVWVATAMLHAATRLGAMSLVFALTQLRFEPDVVPARTPPSPPRRTTGSPRPPGGPPAGEPPRSRPAPVSARSRPAPGPARGSARR